MSCFIEISVENSLYICVENREFMTNQELKITIHTLVDETDDMEVLQSILVLLKKVLSVQSHGNIAGYSASGAPVTKEELIKLVIDADLDIQKGNGVSFEEMKKKYSTQ